MINCHNFAQSSEPLNGPTLSTLYNSLVLRAQMTIVHLVCQGGVSNDDTQCAQSLRTVLHNVLTALGYGHMDNALLHNATLAQVYRVRNAQ
eukprot:213816-Amphidinium_carterae.1